MAKLLTFENAKTSKGEVLDYRTGILYLAPANESGVMDTCPGSTEGCRRACLYSAGLAEVFPKIKEARIEKTKWLKSDRKGFIAQLRSDINELIRYCEKNGMIPAVRINGTSDLPKIAMQLASEKEFKTVQFYDYTKLDRPWTRTRSNYSLTYSYSGQNEAKSLQALSQGINVSVVFDTRKGERLPAQWNGWPVIDGDVHDLRFLDPAGAVIGLRAKGPAKQDRDHYGFVVSATPKLVQIAS